MLQVGQPIKVEVRETVVVVSHVNISDLELLVVDFPRIQVEVFVLMISVLFDKIVISLLVVMDKVIILFRDNLIETVMDSVEVDQDVLIVVKVKDTHELFTEDFERI